MSHNKYYKIFTSCVFKENLIVQSQSKFRHPSQVYLHLDSTTYLTTNYLPLYTNLQYIHKCMHYIHKRKYMHKYIRLTNRFTDSTTSRNTSFLLYLILSALQCTALVTAGGGRGAISSLCPSCVIYLQYKSTVKYIHKYMGYMYVHIYWHSKQPPFVCICICMHS